MGSRQRYVIIGTVLLGALIAVALSHGLAWVWAQAGWDDLPLLSRELTLTRIISYLLAIGGVVFVVKHGRTFQLANEVVEELSKVTWPTREETSNATVVVIATVLICSLYLGLFDAFWLALTNWMLSIPS